MSFGSTTPATSRPKPPRWGPAHFTEVPAPGPPPRPAAAGYVTTPLGGPWHIPGQRVRNLRQCTTPGPGSSDISSDPLEAGGIGDRKDSRRLALGTGRIYL